MAFFERLKAGLAKTKQSIVAQVDQVLKSFVKIDEEMLEELEEVLIMSDMGMETVEDVMEKLREAIRDERLKDPDDVREELIRILREQIGAGEPLHLSLPLRQSDRAG